MKKYSAFILILLLILMQISCSFNLNRSRASVVYQAADEDGKPLPELVVMDTGGKEQRRIELPEDTGQLFALNIPSSRYAFYQDPIENQRFYRVDTQDASFEEYSEFGYEGESVRICNYSMKWVLFCGQTSIYLLNFENGKLSTLPVKLDPDKINNMVFPQRASPDYSAMALRVQNSLWLVQLNSPEDARLLGGKDAPSVITPAFTDDGKMVVYSVRDEDGITHVLREKLDGSDQETILSGEDVVWGVPVPKHEQFLVVREDSVNLLSLKDGNEEELFEVEDIVRLVFFDPKGEHVIVQWGGFKVEEVQWTYLDLKEKEAKTLDDLAGLQNAFHWSGSPWMFAINFSAQGSDSRIVSLDLTNGETRTLLETDEGSNLQFHSASTDGRVMLVIEIGQKSRYWLAMADKDEAIQLEENLRGFSLSPDGKWAVISVRQDSEDQVSPQILLLETATGKEKVLGEGFSPVWLEP